MKIRRFASIRVNSRRFASICVDLHQFASICVGMVEKCRNEWMNSKDPPSKIWKWLKVVSKNLVFKKFLDFENPKKGKRAWHYAKSCGNPLNCTFLFSAPSYLTWKWPNFRNNAIVGFFLMVLWGKLRHFQRLKLVWSEKYLEFYGWIYGDFGDFFPGNVDFSSSLEK